MLLSASVTVVLSDSGGMVVRFPIDELPDGCMITSATLRLDPGVAAADRAVQVERRAEVWSDQATRTPTAVGDSVIADAGAGERAWAVDRWWVALAEGPDRGLLLTATGDGDPGSLAEDGNPRLEIVLGPAQPD